MASETMYLQCIFHHSCEVFYAMTHTQILWWSHYNRQNCQCISRGVILCYKILNLCYYAHCLAGICMFSKSIDLEFSSIDFFSLEIQEKIIKYLQGKVDDFADNFLNLLIFFCFDFTIWQLVSHWHVLSKFNG